MKLAILLGVLAAVAAMFLVGPKLEGPWQGRLIDEASGEWQAVAVRLEVEENETAAATISGTILYRQSDPAGGKKTMTDRQFPIAGTWIRENNQIKLEWSEEEDSFRFNCELRGLLKDLLICYGASTVGEQFTAYRIKLHRAVGWPGWWQ